MVVGGGLPGSGWKSGFRAEVRPAARGQDRGAEALPVAAAAGVPLRPLDAGVDAWMNAQFRHHLGAGRGPMLPSGFPARASRREVC